MKMYRQLVFWSADIALSVFMIPTALAEKPADKFDLKYWKLQLPLDNNKDGKIDEVDVRQLRK